MSQQQSSKKGFRIEVENLFDWEKRKIKVKHKKDNGTDVDVNIDYPEPDPVQQQAPKKRKNQVKFDLSSGEHLEISLGVLGGKPGDDYWYIKLPFVADFKFLSESGNVPLIYEVARNESTCGRIVAFIPTEIDPTACKLIISPPGRLEENYRTQNLTGELAADGDGSPDDNVSIGDNNTG